MGSSKKLILSGILSYLLSLTPLAGTARCDEIFWHTTFEPAVKEAREKNRPIFFDVYKKICPPCWYLDNTVYRDPAVIKYISENFVALKIDGEAQPIKFNEEVIREFPTLIYMNADKRFFQMKKGSMPPSEFLELSQKALTTYASLPPPQRKGATPFRLAVHLGPNYAWMNVWGGQQIVPPSDGAFSFQPLTPKEQRTLRAREILFQAEDSYRRQQWLTCIEQSRSLISFYPDLPESSVARQLEQSIGPDRLERLSKDLVENLGQVYWELAQDKLRQNQIAEAMSYMEKIVQFCPGTRHVSAAQEFLRNVTRATTEQQPAHFRP